MSPEHKKRVVSAVVGLFLLLAIYFGLGHPGVVLITVVIAGAAYYEFLTFTGATRTAIWVSVSAGVVLATWLSLGLPGALLAIYVSALAVLLRGFWRVHRSPPEQLPAEQQFVQARVFGLLYLIVFPSFLPKVHALPHGPLLLLLLIGIIWLGDIGGYYGGKRFGRVKLSPNVSPGKTREGAVAGLLASATWAGVFGHQLLAFAPTWKWVAIGACTAVVAQAGDLLESLMKRAYQVKDSGHLIPGHGGVFDRFDSLILATPFFYLLLTLLT